MKYLPITSHFFFFNDTATTEIYTLSLHDALPISYLAGAQAVKFQKRTPERCVPKEQWHLERDTPWGRIPYIERSEEHTSELQSHLNLVCRLLLEKKK